MAGLTIAAWGVGVAFLANAASFLAVIAALSAMRGLPAQPVASWTGLINRIGEGTAFVSRTPAILWLLVLLTVMSLFPTNYNIFIPVLAQARLGLGAAGFGFLAAANGAGAVLGGLLVASRGRSFPRGAYLYASAVVLSVTTMALSLAARADAAAVLLFLAGAAMVIFSAVSNSTTQFLTPDALRGRVMSIYALIWNGTTPFGSLLVGGLVGMWGLSAGLLVGGGAGLAGTLVVGAVIRRRRSRA